MKFNWDELGQLGRRVADTISDAADTVGKKTGEVVEVQKIKSQIYNMQKENENALRDMGKMIYETYKEKEEVGQALLVFCEEIAQRESEIRECEKKMIKLRGNTICKECQTPLAKGMMYCPTCGAKAEPDKDEDIFESEDIFGGEDIFEEEGSSAQEASAEAVWEAETKTEEIQPEEAESDSEKELSGHVDALEGKEGEV